MENMKTLNRTILVFLFAFALTGCISQIAPLKETADHWVGRPIEERKALVTRPESYPSRNGLEVKTYQLQNDNWVYIEPVRRDCFINWEIDKQGIIVRYRTEGNRCW